MDYILQMFYYTKKIEIQNVERRKINVVIQTDNIGKLSFAQLHSEKRGQTEMLI